jgi:selenophosphate synthetase-related protein
MTKQSMPGRTLVCAVIVIVGAWLLTADGLYARQQTPTQAFTAYRKALATATAYSDILPFMDAKSRAMVEAIPAATQAKMFELMKKFNDAFTDVAVTKETVTGETAVLELSGKDAKGQAARGSVPMTKEASGWKVGSEKWSSKPQ